MLKRAAVAGMIASVALVGVSAVPFAADLKDVIDVLPKFAIPMREVGDRFQNMYFAAMAGNWGLALYMSTYMNNAMNPAKVTKAAEYPLWESFYKEKFEPVNKAIYAKDFAAFDRAYMAVITECNACHTAMGYGFIKVVKMSAPADQGVDYTVQS